MRTAASLRELRWGDSPGFLFTLDNDAPVRCLRILRLLPGKRVSLECEMAGVRRFVKIFWGKQIREGRHEAERQRHLMSDGVSVPRQLEEGGNGGAYWTVSEWLDGRAPDLADPVEARNVLDKIVSLHSLGWHQTDPHVDNFLIDKAGKVHVLDPGSIRPAWPTAQARALASFAAQARVSDARAVEAYCFAILAGRRLETLLFRYHLRRVRRNRIRRLLKKQLRSTSSLVRLVDDSGVIVADRALESADLAALRSSIRADKWESEVKRGRSTSVYVQGDYIAKVYYRKSVGQRIRSIIGLSRAERSWVFGRAFGILGIATARPLLLSRGSDGREVLVTERVDGLLLSHILEADGALGEEWQAAKRELRRMHELGFIHGDAKAQNYLMAVGGMAVIDLDACRWPRCPLVQWVGARREKARFERNLIQFRPGGGAA